MADERRTLENIIAGIIDKGKRKEISTTYIAHEITTELLEMKYLSFPASAPVRAPAAYTPAPAPAAYTPAPAPAAAYMFATAASAYMPEPAFAKFPKGAPKPEGRKPYIKPGDVCRTEGCAGSPGCHLVHPTKPCDKGAGCVHWVLGKCVFYHEGPAPKPGEFPCGFGAACAKQKNGKCPFAHPPVEH